MEWKIGKVTSSLFLLLTAFLSLSAAQESPPGEWGEPYFVSLVPGKVNIGQYSTSLRELDISMWEEIPSPVRIMQINYKGGDLQIRVQPDHIGAQLVHEDGHWYFIVNNRMDFEQAGQRLSVLTLVVESDVRNSFTVAINLINILDNTPSMYSEGLCRIPEHEETFLSSCTYTVHHDDGFVPNEIEGMHTNRIDFNMSDVEDTFEMVPGAVIDTFNKQYKLSVLRALDYAQQAVYNFQVTVYDLNQTHTFTLNVVVQVENVESRVPIFTRPFTTQRILEKTPFSATVTAIDGDTGINADICYSLETDVAAYAKYFSIELDESRKNGILKVQEIDRDTEKNEFYQFKIMAYKCDNELYNITSEAAIILEDKNDHVPTFDVEPSALSFWENTLMELPFERFNIEDIDLGLHATYNVHLQERVSGQIVSEIKSFSIIPNNGYQQGTFTITITNAAQLDYELPERRQFDLIVTATEVADPSHTSDQVVAIELRNWNDEVPIFDKDIYEVAIDETVGSSYDLVTVTITDRDVDDAVELRILSRNGEYLTITPVDTSEQNFPVPTFVFKISTAKDEIFDYDVAKEVIVQLEAKDTLQTAKQEPIHQVFSQVVIKVRDINNKPPSITVPRGRMHIEENSEPGTLVKIEVTEGSEEDAILIGTDPDTTAQLKFSIDWQSSYAVKTGAPVDPEVFEDCLIIDVDSTDHNRVTGRIRVNPELNQSTINERLDYEAYETLFLTVRLVDEKQVIPPGDTEAIIVIQIGNVNDNEPEFVGNTLDVERVVLEEADRGTIVGTIAAIDRDGDPITYSITPKNPNHEGWIAIASTGMLTVDASEKPIDCDVPIIQEIPLEVTLFDGLYTTKGSIAIKITDTNNKVPSLSSTVPPDVEIFEKSPSETEVLQLNVQDLDREAQFHTVAFEIDYKTFPELQKFFDVERLVDNSGERLNQTGLVRVKPNNDVLDRDLGTARFTINVKGYDNPNGFGRQNPIEASFTLILLDVNDHEPSMPVLTGLQLSEDATKGAVLVDRFEATDLDDRSTPNAKINYRIVDIKAGE